MARGSRGLAVFISCTGAAGIASIIWALPRVDVASAAVVVLAVALLEATATRLREDVQVSLTNVAILVAILVGGTALAVVATLGSLPVMAVQVRDKRLRRVAFNIGQFAFSALVAGLAYEFLLWLASTSFPQPGSLLAIALGAVVFSVVNYLLVSGAISLSSADRYWPTFRAFAGSAMLLHIPYVGLAVLAAVLMLHASPWALALMVVPTLVARYGLVAYQRLDETYDQLVRTFVKAIEVKDLYTRGHSERVAQLSVHVAEELGIQYDARRLTGYAALLHDVGKIGVPACIINKPGRLDEDEFAVIKQHPTIGADILHDIDFLAPAIDIVRYHHERLDGRGYPHGVTGDELSDIVRIVTAADAFDAMTSTRSYRRAMPVAAAIAELRRCAGSQFDPRMVEALVAVVERLGWQPTVEFASEAQLHGHEIPMGATQAQLGATQAQPGVTSSPQPEKP